MGCHLSCSCLVLIISICNQSCDQEAETSPQGSPRKPEFSCIHLVSNHLNPSICYNKKRKCLLLWRFNCQLCNEIPQFEFSPLFCSPICLLCVWLNVEVSWLKVQLTRTTDAKAKELCFPPGKRSLASLVAVSPTSPFLPVIPLSYSPR